MNNLTELLIILGIAGLIVPFLHRFRVSPVLGYLLCGIVISPQGPSSWTEAGSALSFLKIDTAAIGSFAELGVIFLMFMIGLKLSLKELWGMRLHVLGLGGCQVLLTGIIVYAIALAFGNAQEIAILMGACFALSSTAMVMQLLDDKHRENTQVGKLCFSILLMQDLAVVPILALVAAFAGNEGGGLLPVAGKALLIAAVAIVLIYVIGLKLLQPLFRYINPHIRPEWLMSFVLFIVIGTATLTHAAGLSAALGAFLAGLLLAETDYSKDIEHIIAPVKGLLMGVFFLSVGLMIDLRIVVDNAFWIFASVVGIGFLKAGLLFVLGVLFKIKKSVAGESAILLGQSGEFVFVILTLAQASNMIPSQDAQFFMMVTAMSMLVTPFVAALAPRVVGRVSKIF